MMGQIEILPIKTPALGDTSYVVRAGDTVIVIDPQRDIERFETAIGALDLAAIVETHLHNDYVSGGPELARTTGAEMIAPAAAAPAYRHRPAFHREPLSIGDLELLPIHTPGHTPEHTSYVLVVEGEQRAVFTGGSLLVGAAGRSDLLGPERADSLSRLQFGSIQRLAALPDHIEVHPTHGQGSFCAAGTGGSASSTVGVEKRTNRLFTFTDEDAFVSDQLGGLGAFPAYYRYMGPLNVLGGTAITSQPEEWTAEHLENRPEDIAVIDTRDRWAFARGHVPGSTWIGKGDSFSAWTGWLFPIEQPFVLVVDEPSEAPTLVTELARIGYDNVIGWTRALPAGVASLRAVEPIDFREAAPRQVLDVRDAPERAATPVDATLGVHLPDLSPETLESLDRAEPVGVVCASGYRAMIAGSLLLDMGYEPIVLAKGGIDDLK